MELSNIMDFKNDTDFKFPHKNLFQNIASPKHNMELNYHPSHEILKSSTLSLTWKGELNPILSHINYPK